MGTGDETIWRPPTLGRRSATGGIPTQSVGTMGSGFLGLGQTGGIPTQSVETMGSGFLGLGQLVDRPIAAKALGNHVVVGVGNGHH